MRYRSPAIQSATLDVLRSPSGMPRTLRYARLGNAPCECWSARLRSVLIPSPVRALLPDTIRMPCCIAQRSSNIVLQGCNNYHGNSKLLLWAGHWVPNASLRA